MKSGSLGKLSAKNQGAYWWISCWASARRTAQGQPEGYAPGKVLAVVFFYSILQQTTKLQKEAFPSPEQNQSKFASHGCNM